MGASDHPLDNPPSLKEGDRFAWEWFHRNVSGFTKDFQLVSMLLADMGLSVAARELFIMKLGMIYGMWKEIGERWPDKDN